MVQIKDIIDFYKYYEYFDVYGNKLETYFLKHSLMKLCKYIHNLHGLEGLFESHWVYDCLSSLSKRKGWNNTKQAITKYFKDNGKTITIEFKDHPAFIIGHFIESLCAFDRSIFWYLNYKHNLDPLNQIASEQALYYSEFFSIVAITRFLGGSISHTPLKLFKIDLLWDEKQISIVHQPNLRSGQHKGYANLFYEQIKRIDLTEYKYFKLLKEDKWIQRKGFLMGQDRNENVYDLSSRIGDPFKNALYADLNVLRFKVKRSWNFLENIEDIYERVGHSDYEGGLAEFLQDEYSGEGYRQDHIGEYWKFLIDSIKKVDDTEQYFKKLMWKISRFEECEFVKLDEDTKRILFKWIDIANDH